MTTRAKCLDPSFVYYDSHETSKPGYLRNKFATVYKAKTMNGHSQETIDWLKDPEAQQDYQAWLDQVASRDHVGYNMKYDIAYVNEVLDDKDQ